MKGARLSKIGQTQASLAVSFCNYLTANRVDYVLVGDVRGFPDEITGDIDIVVSNKDIRKLSKMLREFSSTHGLEIVQQLRHERDAFYTCLVWGEPSAARILKLDVCSDYRRAGRSLISAEELLLGRIKHHFGSGGEDHVYIPSPRNGFVYYLVKRIDKFDLTERNASYLRSLRDEWPEEARSGFLSVWDREDFEVLDQALETRCRSSVDWLRTKLHKRRPKSWRGIAAEISRYLERAKNPTGLTVAILGPDGAGKSTLIENMRSSVGGLFRSSAYQHLRPRIFSARHRSGISVTEPHLSPPYGRLMSVAKLLYLAADYIVGYHLKVRPAVVRSTLYIFDRYYHDILVDPVRYRYQGSMNLAGLLEGLVPEPDLLLVLDAPAEVIWHRKAEVSLEECERQVQAYRELAKRYPYARTIDAGLSPDAVADQAAMQIRDFLRLRMEGRVN